MRWMNALRFSPARLGKLWYIPVLGLGMALMFARLLIMARLLPVVEFASYSAGLLISSSFLMLACLGLHTILQRQLPVVIVRRRERIGVIMTIQCVVIASCCAAILSAAAIPFQPLLTEAMSGVVGVGIVHGLSQQYFLVATTESRSRGDPLRYGKDNLWRSLILLLLCSAAALLTKQASWVLWIEAIVSILLSATLLWKQIAIARLSLPTLCVIAVRGLSRIHWRAALILVLFASLTFVMMNIDRWIAAQVLSADQFAQYAFAWTILLIAQAAQVMVNTSLYPMIARRYAQTGLRSAAVLATKASLGLLVSCLLCTLPVLVFLQYAIPIWFVSYSDALPITPLLLVIAVLRLSDYWTTLLVITGHEASLLCLNVIISAAFGLMVWAYFEYSNHKINQTHIASFAIVMSITSYICSMAMVLWIHRHGFKKNLSSIEK